MYSSIKNIPPPPKKTQTTHQKNLDIDNLLAVSQEDDSQYKTQIRILLEFENTE